MEGAEGTRALVLELVEGPTLADRIAKGAIWLDEGLPIAKQIAEALEAAHEAGVIHRDLKPANIKVRKDGTVKVLDFGLARAQLEVSSDSAESPTLTAAATASGVLLGTAAYMSPEQAKGRSVDKRTDVWAFGCVLYEMLTGRRAFAGESVPETVAAVLTAHVNLDALPNHLPRAGRRLLWRCLERDPNRRLRDVTEGLLQLQEELAGLSGEASAPVATPAHVAPVRRVVQWATAIALAVAIGITAWGLVGGVLPRFAARGVMRFPIPLAPDQTFPTTTWAVFVALSPDGTQVVYHANNRLWLRPLD